jgi:4-hydroxythreonine-4-phosphate dehydrogenase
LGREEIDIIEPALAALKIKTQANLIGPLAADTLFQKKYLADADAIVAMYHDQGLAPLKAMYFGEIVNITCGLPFIRTSVDHGVALDIAGTGTANIDSFLMAVAVTEEMAALSKEH